MEKENLYNLWNNKKKEIDCQNSGRFYREKEIWWCNLGKNIGFEQDGKGLEYERPVLVIKAFSKSVCLVVPLTTSTKKNRYHVDIGNINNRLSCVIISQIRLIDTRRLVNRVCILDSNVFNNIRKNIRELF